MFKPGSLRAHLEAAFPELLTNPDRMVVFIDKGSMVATGTEGLSFEYRYTLNVILTDFAAHPDAVLVPLMIWVRRNQNELLSNPTNRERIGFEVDLLDNDKVDLDIKLPLTERVGVQRRPDGNFDVIHHPEPELEAALQAEHWEIYLKDELLVSWDVPPQ